MGLGDCAFRGHIDLFTHIESAFGAASFDLFVASFENLYDDFLCGTIHPTHERAPLRGEDFCATFAHFWNLRFVEARKIRRPAHTKSAQAIAKILHSVAHIEMSAIVLALDSAYRFRELPRGFYADWLEVARDEIMHFKRICALLSELGFAFGDFAVHDELFAALCCTQDSLELRMGIVHRGLEARGLDANPFVQRKLADTEHALKSAIRDTMDIILHDEISHVHKGDVWWKSCATRPFLQLCESFRFRLAGKILNESARLSAGFSESEINELRGFYSQKQNPRERQL